MVDVATPVASKVMISGVDRSNNLINLGFIKEGTDSTITSDVDGITPTLGTRILVNCEIKITQDKNGNAYKGIYVIEEEPDNENLFYSCKRAEDFDSNVDIFGATVFVKSDGKAKRTAGKRYIISEPVNEDTFVLDESNITFMDVMNNDFGTMSQQDHDNVNITGGYVSVPLLQVNEIKPVDGHTDLSIRLPTDYNDSTFSVRHSTIEDTLENDNDLLFQVNAKGIVSAFEFLALSDRSLKTNEAKIDNSIELVRKLDGKTFDWIDSTKNTEGHKQYGFIAQDVLQNFPTLVTETLNEHLAVDYAKVVAILVEAVKDIHQTLIDSGIEVKSNDVAYTSDDNKCNCCNCPSNDTLSVNDTTPIITQRPIVGDVVTNIIGFGNLNANTIMCTIGSTSYDKVDVSELFESNTYVLYTNQGTNTLDNANIEVYDIVLIKNAANIHFNGVYTIESILDGPQGKFSKAVRVDGMKDAANIHHTMVVIEPLVPYGRGKGDTNPGFSFVCVEPANVSDVGDIDTFPIEFMSVNQYDVRSMAKQDQDNVNITGGSINIETINVKEIKPTSKDVSVIIDDRFNVKNDNGNVVFSVDSNGTTSAYAFYSPSDERLKTNINTIDKSLDLLKLLEGVTFDWKESNKNIKGHKQYGFIAQQVAVNFPTLVGERSDGKLAVDYAKVVAMLVEAVKDISYALNM